MEIKTYNSVKDFIKSIDDEIARLRTALGKYLRDMDDIRSKAERLKRLEETLKKIGGEKPSIIETRELKLGPLSVVINPTPLQELSALEDIVKDVQDRLTILENIRKSLEPLEALEDVEAKVEVYLKDNMPKKVFIRLE